MTDYLLNLNLILKIDIIIAKQPNWRQILLQVKSGTENTLKQKHVNQWRTIIDGWRSAGTILRKKTDTGNTFH